MYTHSYIATEVIQLPHSRQQACFINVEVWLVTMTDENALASNRKHASLSFVGVDEWHWATTCCMLVSHPPPAHFFSGTCQCC